MPGIGHQRGGIEALGVMAGIPVHGLLAGDGNHRRNERQQAGDRGGLRARADVFHRPGTDQQTGDGEHYGQDDRRDAFKALVPVGVVAVGLPGGELHANDDDEAAQHVRG